MEHTRRNEVKGSKDENDAGRVFKVLRSTSVLMNWALYSTKDAYSEGLLTRLATEGTHHRKSVVNGETSCE